MWRVRVCRWTVYDPVNDREIELSARDREIIRNLQRGRFPEPEFDPHVTYGELAPAMVTSMVPEATEPKRRFVPSRHEKQRVNFLAMLMRRGWLKPPADEARERRAAARAASAVTVM